ncbi:MAG: T9SS type A sorting domain-containing protein [candidate division WOR-3 bacterium]
MQKPMCLLLLGLVVGISLASDGTLWIGKSRPEAFSCPNPTPTLTQLPTGDNPDTDTLYYDERTAYTAWIYYRENNGWGVKFNAPADNGTITGALVYLWSSSWPVPGGNRFKVRVVDSDGPNGAPGTTLYESDIVTGNRGQWNNVPMSVPFTNRNFYIFYVQVDSYPMCPALGIDRFDNAPDGVKWQLTSGSYSQESDRFGEWLIRALIDWTPQNNNMGTLFFGNMPIETLPNISLQMRGTVKNFGSQPAAAGVPVKMQITGPLGYVYNDFDQATTVTLQRGQTQLITFSPNWHVPDTMGNYTIKIWTELAGDEYPQNDTITRTLSIGRWITYANWNNPYWITWASPERAVEFIPGNFGLTYPFSISRVKAQFYLHPQRPWDDSLFSFKIYGNDGATLLYQSDTIRSPGSSTQTHDVVPPVAITSGNFYVAVAPRSYSGFPSSLADDSVQNHSFYGGAGSWIPWPYGELFIAAAVRQGVGIEEKSNPAFSRPKLTVTNYPNPTNNLIRIEWQIPEKGNLRIDLFDVTGREVKTIYDNYAEANGIIYMRTEDLAAGAYLIRLRNGKETATAKLLVQK